MRKNNSKCKYGYASWLSSVKRYAGILSKTHAKADQYHAEIKNRFVDNTCRMICFTTSSIRQLYHFATDFNRVLLSLVDTYIMNALSKYRVSYRHLTFMIETFELSLKSWEKFDLLFVNTQCATVRSLQKWTLKFKLLYLKNHINNFTKIHRICCTNTTSIAIALSMSTTTTTTTTTSYRGDRYGPIEWSQ